MAKVCIVCYVNSSVFNIETAILMANAMVISRVVSVIKTIVAKFLKVQNALSAVLLMNRIN